MVSVLEGIRKKFLEIVMNGYEDISVVCIEDEIEARELLLSSLKSDWQRSKESLTGMAVLSGQKVKSIKGQHFTSLCRH